MITEMPVTLLDIQQVLHSRVNDWRSLQRIVETTDFEIAYKQATEEQRRIATQLIKNGEKDNVLKWIALQERNRTDIEELPVRELRKLAGSLGIAGYQFLTKASLLSQIKGKELDK